jgi:hypothetical protein
MKNTEQTYIRLLLLTLVFDATLCKQIREE